VEQIDEDLKLLNRLAAIASGRLGALEGWDLNGVVREFDSGLRAEVDYLKEGHNAERFEQNFEGSQHVHIPRVFWDSTTTRVLTMEKITGSRITDAPALRDAGIDRDQVAENAAKIILKMLLEDGFFHADLHPGNLFIESEKRIGLIDFGMVGVIDEQARFGLVQLLMAIGRRDSDGMINGLVALGMADPKADRGALKKDLERLVTEYYERAIGETNLAAVFDDAFAVLRAHKLVMPSALSMLAKTLVTAEGMVAQLDPTFRMIDATEPYLTRMVIKENCVRVKSSGAGWRAGTAHILDDEDPRERQRTARRVNLARGLCVTASEVMGTNLLTIRIDLDVPPSAPTRRAASKRKRA
jgi:ubiquinone biosynthesis protein